MDNVVRITLGSVMPHLSSADTTFLRVFAVEAVDVSKELMEALNTVTAELGHSRESVAIALAFNLASIVGANQLVTVDPKCIAELISIIRRELVLLAERTEFVENLRPSDGRAVQ